MRERNSCCQVKLVFLDRRKTFVKNIESQEREIREADIRADNFTYSVGFREFGIL